MNPASHQSLEEISNSQRIKAILVGSYGNLIEWYDFYIYAFTALYFSSAFFPKDAPLVQVMATSGIFAAGFVMRPLGGWYFGRLADRAGRRTALITSVIMMGAGSLLIAVLPTYALLGGIAPALLLVGRMLQGFSTGGQYGTAATYLSEIATKDRRGFWASFQYVTLVGGQLLAAIVVLMLQYALSEEQMREFGWRIAFIIGALGAGTLLLFREHLHETGGNHAKAPEAGSMRQLLGGNFRSFATVIGLTAGGSLSFYTFTTYLQKYFVLSAGMTKERSTQLMTGLLFLFMLLQPVTGWLSDKIGRKNNIVIFGVLSTFLTVPILSGIASVGNPAGAFVLALCGVVINSFYTSVSGLFKAELFPAHIRAMGVGVAYGVGNAVFGGTAENIAFAFKESGNERYFYWYVSAICLISLITALTMKDNRRFSELDNR